MEGRLCEPVCLTLGWAWEAQAAGGRSGPWGTGTGPKALAFQAILAGKREWHAQVCKGINLREPWHHSARTPGWELSGRLT